jgi:hypothetical protein
MKRQQILRYYWCQKVQGKDSRGGSCYIQVKLVNYFTVEYDIASIKKYILFLSLLRYKDPEYLNRACI